MLIPWSTINAFLLILVICGIIYVWYKQPMMRMYHIAKDTMIKEQLNQQINDSLIEALILTDEHGMILQVNKATERMFRYPENSLKGVNILNLIPEKYRRKHFAGLTRIREGGEPHILGKTVDLEGLRSDGEVFPVALSISKIVTNNHTVFVGVIRDVTERVHISEQIQQLNQALTVRLEASEAFNQTVSHDLNAPLRSIDGFTEILEQDYCGSLDEKGKDYIYRIRGAIHKLRQLVKDMQRLSIVTQPDTQLDLTKFSLANMFRVALSECKMADPRNVTTKVPDDMEVMADPSLLGLAVINLVSNAWKYTSKNPEACIEVGFMWVDNKKVYFVKDNGVGFDQSQANKLFLPFSRLHQTEFEGSGIGLTIVKRIIELHKGQVWAKGVVGEGATFYFTIGT
jgi:PAS domain S-box-containing protein